MMAATLIGTNHGESLMTLTGNVWLLRIGSGGRSWAIAVLAVIASRAAPVIAGSTRFHIFLVLLMCASSMDWTDCEDCVGTRTLQMPFDSTLTRFTSFHDAGAIHALAESGRSQS